MIRLGSVYYNGAQWTRPKFSQQVRSHCTRRNIEEVRQGLLLSLKRGAHTSATLRIDEFLAGADDRGPVVQFLKRCSRFLSQRNWDKKSAHQGELVYTTAPSLLLAIS